MDFVCSVRNSASLAKKIEFSVACFSARNASLDLKESTVNALDSVTLDTASL